MAIQFQCPACSEPIEIDPEWGGKLVACPYCRKTVTAPLESTLGSSQVPMAKPWSGGGASYGRAGQPPLPPPAYEVRPVESNAAAVWAMLLTCAAMVCLVLAISTSAAHVEELKLLTDAQTGGASMTEMNKALLERYPGGLPGWLLRLIFGVTAALAFWVIGLVCGLIAVRRRARRKLTLASLTLSALLAVYFLMSLLAPRV